MKTRDKNALLKDLESIATNGAQPFEKRLVDTAVWFHKNLDRIPKDNLSARMDFLEKSMDITLELLAMSLERIHSTENRQASERLWLPRGMIDIDTGRTYG